MVETEGTRAGAPLPIASDSDDEWPVGSIEQLIRNEIRVRVTPPFGVDAGNEHVLRDIHECSTRALDE